MTNKFLHKFFITLAIMGVSASAKAQTITEIYIDRGGMAGSINQWNTKIQDTTYFPISDNVFNRKLALTCKQTETNSRYEGVVFSYRCKLSKSDEQQNINTLTNLINERVCNQIIEKRLSLLNIDKLDWTENSYVVVYDFYQESVTNMTKGTPAEFTYEANAYLFRLNNCKYDVEKYIEYNNPDVPTNFLKVAEHVATIAGTFRKPPEILAIAQKQQTGGTVKDNKEYIARRDIFVTYTRYQPMPLKGDKWAGNSVRLGYYALTNKFIGGTVLGLGQVTDISIELNWKLFRLKRFSTFAGVGLGYIYFGEQKQSAFECYPQIIQHIYLSKKIALRLDGRYVVAIPRYSGFSFSAGLNFEW
jgi:hypothetical protein